MKSKSELVEKLRLPREFLSQILQKLTRARILVSKRRARGGYTLKKPAEETKFLHVIQAIDGKSNILECLSVDFKDCGRRHLCQSIMGKMSYLQGQIESLLDSVSFRDITVPSPGEID